MDGPTELVGDAADAAAAELLPDCPVVFAYLYGSRTGERSRPDSDVDVGIALDPAVDDPDRPSPRGSPTRSPRDSRVGGLEVTVLDGAPIRFLGRVLRSRVVLYSRDEPARVEFESRIGRMADDVEVWAAPMDRELLAAIAEGRR